ncbi:LOW QUALITY PROTEIN: pannexin-2 [Pteropus alecto]|uniref:LOW QUALITY PROTEIN: pannexin-2 n=1 Tax=Pteropus alecto TaxID=9402 RepID=UPI000D537022|nr:LOW QUALITY PROTEIN: pannexin-2 [Pteropus alecto]
MSLSPSTALQSPVKRWLYQQGTATTVLPVPEGEGHTGTELLANLGRRPRGGHLCSLHHNNGPQRITGLGAFAEKLTNQGNGAFAEKELRSRQDMEDARVGGDWLLSAGPQHRFQPPGEGVATATPAFQLDFLFGNLTKSFQNACGNLGARQTADPTAAGSGCCKQLLLHVDRAVVDRAVPGGRAGQMGRRSRGVTGSFDVMWAWEEPIYCYTPHNFTRDQALYARGYCWTELRDALPGVDASLWPSLFEHKLLPYSLLAFAAIMYVPALGWEFLASTRLTSELNFLLQEIDNCYHRAAEGRAPKIEKQIQSKGPGITEREKREIIENAEKEKSPEQNLFEKYLERRGRSNFLAKLYLARHLLILLLSVAPISYLCTYYATQKQNEFTCALGASPDGPAGGGGPAVRVSCKLPSVQLQRIVAGVDIVLLCSMNLIILVNLIHLFIFRKSNFIFDKLHKVGIKTRRQWRRSQFCDINILAMFCNENRDHIKSLNRLDFITNESDLMYDNVVRQLLAALAQSNHDATPTPAPDKKHTRHFSLDVHPYILGAKKAKPEPVPAALPASRSQEGGFLSQAEECGLGLATAPTKDASLPAEDILFPAEPPRAALPSGVFFALPSGVPFHICSPPAAPATAPLSPAGLGKADALTILSRNATHPLLHIGTLYEAREEEDGGPRAPPDVGGLIALPPPQQILIATFDEPRTVVSTVEF